jgi:clan AA aspartic protease
MKGTVDDSGRALLIITVIPPSLANGVALQAWVDTGFTGDLILPQSTVNELNLPMTGVVEAVLADGSKVALIRYTCDLLWFGEKRQLEVVANEGATPLLGVGLLTNRRLTIDYRANTLHLE